MSSMMRGLGARVLSAGSRAFFALLLVSIPHVALPAGFNQGDLLVTDNGGARVLRIDVTSGAVSVFSPSPGGTNLLSLPAGIAIADDGTVYVASNGSNTVIQINPLTGDQTAVVAAQGPWGVDIDTAGNLFVLAASSGKIWKHTKSDETFLIMTDPLLIDAWGLAVQADGTLRIGGDTSGLLSIDPSLVTPSVSVVEPPVEAVMKVVGVSRLESTTQFGPGSGGTDCSGRLAGVWNHEPPSWQQVAANFLDGTGPFHCVFSLALTPDNQTYYVGDAGFFLGGNAQVLQVDSASGNVTTLASISNGTGFALPAGIAIAPITAPEPNASASLLAGFAALWTLGELRHPSGVRAG